MEFMSALTFHFHRLLLYFFVIIIHSSTYYLTIFAAFSDWKCMAHLIRKISTTRRWFSVSIIRQFVRIIFLGLVLHSAKNITLSSYKKNNEKVNDVQYFVMKNGDITMPSHMDLVDLSMIFDHGGFNSIDAVHREGKIHVGAWIFLVDSSLHVQDPKILVLKRGEQLITCPGTWSLLGEHAFRDESNLDTVHRAIFEELGGDMLKYVNDHGKISNLTDLPVYYERDYGSSNGGRIDRQLTYLWLVELNVKINHFSTPTERKAHEQIIENLLHLDDEVEDHRWISINELKEMLPIRPKEDFNEQTNLAFCHHTIISLSRLGLKQLEFIHENKIS